MEDLELIERAVEHVATGESLLMEMLAVKSFEEQQLIDQESVADEVVSLAKRFEVEMGHACANLNQFLKIRDNGPLES